MSRSTASKARAIEESTPEGRTLDLPMQTRDVRLMAETAQPEVRTVEVVWSTGAAVRRRDLWTNKRYDEVLSLDPAHVDLSRLGNGAPLLNTHGAFDLEDVIGVVERAWIAKSGDAFEGRAVVRFSERDDVDPIWPDVRTGIIRNVSVGYTVRAYEVIEEDGSVPVWRAVDWQPVELSAVPVGADGGAGFRQRQDAFPCRLIHRAQAAHQPENEDMDQQVEAAVEHPAENCSAEVTTVETKTENQAEKQTGDPSAKPEAPAKRVPDDKQVAVLPVSEPTESEGVEHRYDQRRDPGPSAEEIAERVVAAERERVAGIYDAARKLGIDTPVADDLIRRGVTLEEARGVMIDKAAERDQAVETRPHVRLGALDETETRRAAVETALLYRFDPHRYQLTEPARDWRGYSLIEMARSFLEAEGVRVRGLSRDEIATRALHTTSDFPQILAAVTGKTLRDAYEAAPRTFQPIARRATAADFKDIHRLQLARKIHKSSTADLCFAL